MLGGNKITVRHLGKIYKKPSDTVKSLLIFFILIRNDITPPSSCILVIRLIVEILFNKGVFVIIFSTSEFINNTIFVYAVRLTGLRRVNISHDI